MLPVLHISHPVISPKMVIGCGHCKKLAPIYDQLAEVFRNEPNCVIAKLNGDIAKDVIKKYPS